MAKTKLSDEKLVLNIIINGDQGQKELNDLKKSVTSLSNANTDLNGKLAAITDRMKKLYQAGKNTEIEYQDLQAESHRLQKAIDQNNDVIRLAETRMEALRKGMDLATMSVSDLRKEETRLLKLRNTAVPDSDQWKQYDTQLKTVSGRIKELTGHGQRAKMSLCDMASTVANSMISLYATFKMVLQPLGKAVEKYTQFSDVLADARKTTGLTTDEINSMNESLENVDTRTSQENLMGLVRIAGKLGITGTQNIEGFVRAADQIVVALSEDLGGNVEETVNQIGKLVDIFKLKDQFGIEDAMLKVGSTINALGAASTANEGYIVEFTKRVAGVAPMAGIAATDVMGLAATLDMFGQTAEVSTTVYSQMIMRMFQDTSTYAKLANMDLKSFSSLLNEDVNEAFIRVLDGMKGNNAGMQAVVDSMGDMGLEGKRAIGVLGVLSSNTEALRQQQNLANQSFAEGTSLTNEFNVKNNTAQAQVDKYGKELTKLTKKLGEDLAPAYVSLLSATGTFMQLITPLAGFLAKNTVAFAAAAIAMGAYTVAVNWSTIANSKFILSAKKLFLALASNPITLIIGLVVALSAKLIEVALRTDSVSKAMKRVQEATKGANTEIETEKSKLDRLFGALKAAKKETEQYEGIKKAIVDQYGDYLSGLDKEKRSLEDVEGAQQALTLAIVATARAKAMNNAMTEAQSKYGEKAAAIYGRMQKDLISKLGDEKGMSLFAKLREDMEAGLPINPEVLTELKALKENYFGIWSDIDQLKNAKTILNTELSAIESSLGKTQAEILADQKRKANQLAEQNAQQQEDNKKTQQQLSKEERERLEKEAKAHKKATEDYIAELVNQAKTEDQLYQDRLKKAGLFGKKREQLQGDELIAFNQLSKEHLENLKKIEDEKKTASEEADKKYYDSLEKDLKDRLELIQKSQAIATNALLSRQYDELQALQDKGNDALQIMKSQHQDELANFHGTANERTRLIREQNDEELLLSKSNFKDQQKLRDDQAIQEKEQAASHARELIASIEELFKYGFVLTPTDFIKLDELSPEQVASLKAQLLELKKKLLGNTSTDKPEDPKDPKADKSTVDVLGFSVEDWKALYDNLEKGKIGIQDLQMAAQTLSQIWSSYNNLVAANESKQLKAFEKNNKKKEQNLKTRLKNGTLSQDDYNTAIELLDDQLDKKKEQIQKKQAKRAKALSIFEAIVNTAVSVTSALKVAPPLGLILAGIVGGIGAAQVATIAASQYAKGKYPIVGSDDGKTYHASYVGTPKTGVYTEPSIGLFSEKDPELVVDGATTRKLMFNYPQIYRSIMEIARGSVPQYADGRYPKDTSSQSLDNPIGFLQTDPEIKRLFTELFTVLASLQNMQLFVSMFGKNGLYPAIKKAEQYEQKIKK